MDGQFISVIVATLLRSSLQRLLDSLDAQTLARKNWELIKLGPDDSVNEFEVRNRAVTMSRGEVLTFLDDDTCVPSYFLEKVATCFQDPRVKVLTCPIEGDIWGTGKWVRIDKPYLGTGACLSARKDAFNSVGGFIVDWGLARRIKGWRSDSALLYSMVKSFGPQSYVHIRDLTVFHPKAMKSKPVPQVEREFYRRFKYWALRYIAPSDPAFCKFLLKERIETDPSLVKRLKRLAYPLSRAKYI